MQTHSFDFTNPNYQTEPKRRCSKCLPLTCVIVLLIVGLIVAIIFAIRGAKKPCSETGYAVAAEICPSNPIVWQDMVCCRQTCKKNWNQLPLLLISLDGFRYDYLFRNKTPSLKRLIECGVHAPFMYPSYPTKTFPNHYSIVTGLYPESHGIIDNVMYDENITPEHDRLFRPDLPGSKNAQWWLGEPFWNTMTKNGMKSATYFWPGSELPIQNMTPTYRKDYNKSVEFYLRVDQIIDWLLLPNEQRPAFLTLYFEQPDSDGHQFGPNSPQVTNTLLNVDSQINYLLSRLFQEDLLHCLHLVILADHGMQQLFDYVLLDDYINTDKLTIFTGPVARISLNESEFTADEIRSNLTCRNTRFHVYLREDTPKNMHFSRISRIGDVIVDGNMGVEILANTSKFGARAGDHGYDYRHDSMHALFLAWGPTYKQNFTIKPFQNIELYNFFADTLKIQIRASNNGTLGTLDDIFLEPPERDFFSESPIQACQLNVRSCGNCTQEVHIKECKNLWSQNAIILSPTNNQQQCIGQICNTTILYNYDLGVSTAIINVINDITSLESSPETNGCAKGIFSNVQCETVISIGGVLDTLGMGMYQLDKTRYDAGDNEIWDLKAPMHNGFYTNAWQELENLTITYTQQFDHLIVISGPIFDYNFDGLADDVSIAQNGTLSKYNIKDILIPSHYYRILIRCIGEWTFPLDHPVHNCKGELDALSFILPNTPIIDNCMDLHDYLLMHMGRIRDIELLIGVDFFPPYSSDDLTHKIALLRTQISNKLW